MCVFVNIYGQQTLPVPGLQFTQILRLRSDIANLFLCPWTCTMLGQPEYLGDVHSTPGKIAGHISLLL